MVYKWNELDYNGFKETIKDLWKSKPYMQGNTLEIQVITPLFMGYCRRYYLTRGINPANFAPEFLKDSIQGTNSGMPKEAIEYVMTSTETLFLIVLTEEREEPLILPIQTAEISEDAEFFEKIWTYHIAVDLSIFDDTYFPNWYTRDKTTNKVIAKLGKRCDMEKVEDEDKLFRVRAITTRDWEYMVTRFNETHTVPWINDDIKRDDIEGDSDSLLDLRKIRETLKSMLQCLEEED